MVFGKPCRLLVHYPLRSITWFPAWGKSKRGPGLAVRRLRDSLAETSLFALLEIRGVFPPTVELPQHRFHDTADTRQTPAHTGACDCPERSRHICSRLTSGQGDWLGPTQFSSRGFRFDRYGFHGPSEPVWPR